MAGQALLPGPAEAAVFATAVFVLNATRMHYTSPQLNVTVALPAATLEVSMALQMGRSTGLATRGNAFATPPLSIAGGRWPLVFSLIEGVLPLGVFLDNETAQIKVRCGCRVGGKLTPGRRLACVVALLRQYACMSCGGSANAYIYT